MPNISSRLRARDVNTHAWQWTTRDVEAVHRVSNAMAERRCFDIHHAQRVHALHSQPEDPKAHESKPASAHVYNAQEMRTLSIHADDLVEGRPPAAQHPSMLEQHAWMCCKGLHQQHSKVPQTKCLIFDQALQPHQ